MQKVLEELVSIAILGMLAVIVLFYLVRGMVRLEAGRSGRTLVRFNAFERFVHWMTATCFVVLAVSGLNVTFGKELLTPLIGAEAFAGWSQWAKYAHNYMSFPFTLGVILIFLIWLAWGLLVIVTGTVVTGSGPHGGDEDAPRFGFAIGDVARIHGIAVVLFLAATLALVYRAHRLGSWSRLATPLTLLVWTIVVQGAIGYAQYFSDVPALLVGFHVAGSVLVWAAAVELTFATRAPIGQTEAAPSEASEPSAVEKVANASA